jgi:anti-sigma factor RsiW
MLQPQTLLCERTRGRVSLSLDGELSEFERALLVSHLKCCAECAQFAAEVTATTGLLRETPLEPMPRVIAVPARRRSARSLTLRLGAAAAVLVGAFGLAGSITISSEPRVGSTGVAPGATDETNDRLIRVSQRQAMTPLPPLNNRHAVLMPL